MPAAYAKSALSVRHWRYFDEDEVELSVWGEIHITTVTLNVFISNSRGDDFQIKRKKT